MNDYSEIFEQIKKIEKPSITCYGAINTKKIDAFQKWYHTDGLLLNNFLRYIGDNCNMLKYENQLYLLQYHYTIENIDSQIIQSKPFIINYMLCEWKTENDNGFLCTKEGKKLL